MAEFVFGIEAIAEVHRRNHERREEEERLRDERRKRVAENARRAELEKQREERLHSLARDWRGAAEIRSFLDALELAGDQSTGFVEVMQWGRAVADRLDPLSDPPSAAAPRPSLTGKAMHYLARQWPKLSGVLEDGRLPLDTNLVENAIRPFVLGRKNWLFADTVAGARASANLYGLIETAKANRIEPNRYLTHLFELLPNVTSPDQLDALLPQNLARDSLAPR